MAPLLSTTALTVTVGAMRVAERLDLAIPPGECLVVLGRNGAGKTTLLHTLAGLRPPAAGEVRLCGVPYAECEARRAAQLRGLLPQQQVDAFPSTVLETALIGRHPHLGRWSWESRADERIAREALSAVALGELAARDVQTLSGGERQRLAVATLLTQQPQLYLLDEPLAHLDLNHQIAVLELFSARARAGAAVVMVLHDVNLALRYADRALLLFGDGGCREGPAAETIEAAALSRLYGHPLRAIADGAGRHFVPE